MTYNEIIALALYNTHTKAAQVDATMLQAAFNYSRNRIAKTLIQGIGENYFFEIWKRDAVANQENGEYPYPIADEHAAGAEKITGVLIKGYSTDVDYTPCREVDIKNLDHDWSWYLVNQPKSDPIYFIGDESLFIAPQFATADLPAEPDNNRQIKLTGIAKLEDLAAGATSAAILLPSSLHIRIALGMEEFIYKARKMKSEAAAAKSDFEYELTLIVDELTNRNNSNMQASLPDETATGYGE